MGVAASGARWRDRKIVSALIRFGIFVVPIAAAVLTSWAVARLLPEPLTVGARLLWWVTVLVTSTLVMWAVDLYARRLLPLAVLLRISLLFPDKAPPRVRVLRRAGSVNRLAEALEEAKEIGHDDLALAAERILTLAAALNVHDRRTRGHAERVRVYTDLIAEQMGLSADDKDRLRWAALLHDIGKLEVHPDILNKPGKPTEEEWEVLRSHPGWGAEIVAPLADWLGEWVLAVGEHHEKYDGTGYPRGIAGQQISLAARVVAVADVYDVITSARSYKQAMSAAAAREELARSAGTHFDPGVVRAFLNVSLGRLRWAMGPIAWLTQIPLITGLQRLARDFVMFGGTAAALTTLAVTGIVGPNSKSPADGEPTAVAPITVTVATSVVPTTTPPTTGPPPEDPPTSLTSPSTTTTPTTTTTTPPTTTTTPPTTTTAPTTTTTTPTTTTAPPANLAPVATGETVATDEDVAVTVAVLANDTDPDGDSLTVSRADSTSALGGSVSCSADSCTYTPPANVSGTDSFAYEVSDPDGSTARAVVTITIASVNDAPIAVNDTASTSVDGSVLIFVLENDSDVEGDQIVIVGGTSGTAQGGTVTCSTFCDYTPPAGFTGTDSFQYTIINPGFGEDSSTGTVTVTVG